MLYKMKLLVLILLCSCAYGSSTTEDYANQEETKQAYEPIPIIPTVADLPIKHCKLEDEIDIKDCKLYIFTCDDGYDSFIFRCPIRNLGQITNPPRPI